MLDFLIIGEPPKLIAVFCNPAPEVIAVIAPDAFISGVERHKQPIARRSYLRLFAG